MIKAKMRKIAMWLVWNVNLGRLAPHVLGFALSSKPQEVQNDK